MRFEISINRPLLNSAPVLQTRLFTIPDSIVDGVYYSATTAPDDRSDLLDIIELCVNQCLLTYLYAENK
jgi:hypothetical protein